MNLRIVATILFAILAGLNSSGCQRTNESGAKLLAMRIGDTTFHLEVADSDASRTKGLMHRKSMPQDEGMIFVFPDEAVREFWMRNTYIPLDIIYLSGTGQVVVIDQMKPLDETPVSSSLPAKWAIELNQGAASKCGVKLGNHLEIPAEARHARN